MSFAFSCPIYPIVGDTVAELPPLTLAERILEAGAPLLQLRLKDATTATFVEIGRELRARCDRHRATLIVNDRCDIAKLIGADGVHLGQEDLPPTAAREMLGPEAVIGYSTHNREQLDDAISDRSIDYIAYGPIFDTSSKRNPDPTRGVERLREAARRCNRPLVAIGGIDASNLQSVIAAGADAAAIIGAIAGSDDPAASTRRLIALAGTIA